MSAESLGELTAELIACRRCLRLVEWRGAQPRESHPFLEQAQRVLERQVPFLEVSGDLFKAAERLLERRFARALLRAWHHRPP